jgi:hypothetical protein
LLDITLTCGARFTELQSGSRESAEKKQATGYCASYWRGPFVMRSILPPRTSTILSREPFCWE